MDSQGIPPALVAALAEARRAIFEYDDASAWFASVAEDFREPLAVEVWVFDPQLSEVLLVQHRWRGWVPPGGAANPGERPRDAAVRELAEETGLLIEPFERPAAVTLRSYHPDRPITLGLSYASMVEPSVPIRSEEGQPAAWLPLSRPWESTFPDDRHRMAKCATWLQENQGA